MIPNIPRTLAAHYGIKTVGRVFSITGGASGMGRATAHLLTRHGAAAIWIADRQTSAFDKVRKELNEINKNTKVYLEDVDVGDNTQVKSWVQRIVKESGALHGAANVAGIPQKPVMGTAGKTSILLEDDEEWGRIMRVNLSGVKDCTRAQIEAMLKMDKGSNPAIVNISSLAALVHSPTVYAYSVSKAACDHFTKSVAKDVDSSGIRINGVLPGNTLAPMTKLFFGDMSEDAIADFGVAANPIHPDDVARVVVWLLSENSLHVDGVSLPVGKGEP